MGYLGTKPANQVIDSTLIADGTVTTSDLANQAVTQDKIAPSAQYMGFKNRIINGAMMIDQRNAGASVTPSTNGYYTLDRWHHQISPTSKFSVQQSSTAPTGFKNSMLITSLSAYSVGSGDYETVNQAIEGLNCADLAWGTASASPVTLSFWVRSSLTGTFGGSIQNHDQSRSYPFSYTISSANTFEYKTVTIAGDTSGTWLTTNETGIRVKFGLGVGSTYSGTAGSWSSNLYLSATGAVSVVGTNGATFYITGVQLEKGSTATSFDYRPYGTELQLCQRYYWRMVHSVTQTTAFGHNQTTNIIRATYIAPVPMRAAPSYSTTATNIWLDTTTSGNTTSQSVVDINGVNIILEATVSGAATGRFGIIYSFGGVTNFSSEL